MARAGAVRFPGGYALSSLRTKGTRVTTLFFLAQSSGQQGGGLLALLPFLLIGGAFYFLLIRPQRAQRQRQQQLVNALAVGDEILTIAGMYGTIVEIDDDTDTVTVEVAPGTRVRMLRRAISQRISEDEGEDGAVADDEPADKEAEPGS
jgi:preprotein translocase subunit YajC